ncbi:hypothetical protein BBP40_010505 [Aspergillus hancockii]|nr:hypothetical protein BBP40_010505 [Aspergillus hancockii]
MEEVAAYYLESIKPYWDEKTPIREDVSRPALVSSVVGRLTDPATVDAAYWVKNLVKTARKGSVFIVVVEIGSHAALKHPIKQTVDLFLLQRSNRPQMSSFTYLSSLLLEIEANEALLDFAGSLSLLGAPIEPGTVNQTDMRKAHVVTGLPAYAWDKSISYQVHPRLARENLYSGEPFQPLLGMKTWTFTAHFGRHVEIGKKDSFHDNPLTMRAFYNDVTFSGIDIRGLFKHRPEEVKDIFSEVVNLLQRQIITPIQPVTILPMSQFVTGLCRLKSGDSMGKVVVTLGKHESVIAESTLRPSRAMLDPKATYIIIGGTRGIDHNITYWTIENGACNIVLLGRIGCLLVPRSKSY